MTVTWPTMDGPMGGAETVLQISDADGKSLAKIPSTAIDPFPKNTSMVFSIWWKCNGTSTTMAVNVLGKDAEATITNEWQRYILVVENPGEERLITFLPEGGAPEIYMAMAQLEVGSFASDWRDATEDFATSAEFNIFKDEINGKVSQIGVGYSLFKQTADSINLIVSNNNGIIAREDFDDDTSETNLQITKDGMTVNTGGTVEFKSGNETTVDINPGSFVVNTEVIELNGAGNNTLRIDDNGGSMDNLTVNKNFYAPNVSLKYTGSSYIDIGARSSGDGHDYYPTLTAFTAYLNNRYLDKSLLVQIRSDIYDVASIGGVNGTGSIRIEASGGSVIYGGLGARNCTVPIVLYGVNIESANQYMPLSVHGCPYVEVDGGIFYGPSGNAETATRCINVTDGANVYLNGCYLYNAWMLIRVDIGCK